MSVSYLVTALYHLPIIIISPRDIELDGPYSHQKKYI